MGFDTIQGAAQGVARSKKSTTFWVGPVVLQSCWSTVASTSIFPRLLIKMAHIESYRALSLALALTVILNEMCPNNVR